ncbi:flagellar protein FlaG [Ectopseudomonas mendocina]|uniref:Flagellar biosynthesis protein FlaG n=1 Tax=Ectopseudomonas mendocina TaxID=300 RepID=A0A2R3QTE2_ECTME|nr:flagellar protein FlaG [Pseudomonas mendocina]AVO55036.1 flagellar biosynthesis protein FlaG [Pseudomonas mendocina]
MDVSSIKPQVNSTVVRDGGVSNAAETRQKQGLSTIATVSNTDEQAAARAVTPAQDVSREQVEDAVATIQEFVQSVRRSINFAVDDGSGRVVVKVTDAGSGDVIRQIPSEEALKLAENLSEVRSLLFKAEA